jgi:predicted flap endonuclease-1-like 5' DNA nuclease
VALDDAQRALAARADTDAAARERDTAKIARIESLFEELAEEVREQRDAAGLDALRARIDDVETLVLQAGSDEERLRGVVHAQERAIAKLSESLPAPPMPGARSGVHAGDDLTRIKGIGPKYARLLAGMGVLRFSQIAAWSGDDVDRAARQLGIPRARIEKAGWVEAAARLAGDSVRPEP